VNHAPDPEGMPATSRVLKREEKERFFEMPSFENAAKILLDLEFLCTFMPFAGIFAQLTILHLERVWFDGPCLLGDAVSSSKSRWRRPCLQVLKIRNARGLSDLVINSESLLEVELSNLDSLWELRIEATVLKILTVVNCCFFCFRATVSAPLLVFLEWSDLKGQCSVELGQMPHPGKKISAGRIRNFRDILFTGWVRNFSSIVRNFHIFKILLSNIRQSSPNTLTLIDV
jgi:hypothetical protein